MNREWMRFAACAGHPTPEIFFPSAAGAGARKQAAEAARVCADCPVILQCREYQQATGSAFGVWGGRIVRTQVFGSTGTPNAVHGTEAMHARHLRRGETPCQECREASARAWRLRYARRNARRRDENSR